MSVSKRASEPVEPRLAAAGLSVLTHAGLLGLALIVGAGGPVGVPPAEPLRVRLVDRTRPISHPPAPRLGGAAPGRGGGPRDPARKVGDSQHPGTGTRRKAAPLAIPDTASSDVVSQGAPPGVNPVPSGYPRVDRAPEAETPLTNPSAADHPPPPEPRQPEEHRTVVTLPGPVLPGAVGTTMDGAGGSIPESRDGTATPGGVASVGRGVGWAGAGRGTGDGSGGGRGIGPGAGEGGWNGAGSGNGVGLGVGPVLHAKPRYRENPAPEYPWAAQQRGEQGTVLVEAWVRTDGSVGEARVHRSSGVEDLDRAATQAVRRWRFEPARRDQAPVATWVRVPIRFRLEE